MSKAMQTTSRDAFFGWFTAIIIVLAMLLVERFFGLPIWLLMGVNFVGGALAYNLAIRQRTRRQRKLEQSGKDPS
jgi:Flp pilus assembly protein TadB